MSYDYVVVGAGSAGAVLAARLSEDRGTSVALVEFGGSDASPFIQMPAALSIPMNLDRFDWGLRTDPEPGLDGRVLHCPRGKVLGGSSSINGMVYVRGHACDFDAWADAGAAGWSYAEVLPYFRRAESWVGGADAWRGGDGPLGVGVGSGMRANPLYAVFVEAGVQAGYPRTQDYNARQQEGFGAMHMTVAGGRRASTANAYLRPARRRPNLRVLTRALARRVVLEGRRAVGVEIERGGEVEVLRARREVVLSAGAIGSPALLQRSGIGPGEALAALGIPVALDLPGVGANLQDHLEVYFQYRCSQPITLNARLGWWSRARIGARWLLFKDGLGASNHFESCAFIRSGRGVRWPDVQYHFLPGAMRYDGRAAFDGHGFQVHVGPNRPRSRGRVLLRSPDPRVPPSIRFDYLTAPRDVEDWRRVIALTREIIAQPAFDAYRGDEIQPGADITGDDAIDAWVRASVESAYHPCGTCRMGGDGDPGAVLDPRCRVRGTEGLRVVDAATFPAIPNGNINAPTIMVAERAADLIRGRPPLAPSPAEAWINPRWESAQR